MALNYGKVQKIIDLYEFYNVIQLLVELEVILPSERDTLRASCKDDIKMNLVDMES